MGWDCYHPLSQDISLTQSLDRPGIAPGFLMGQIASFLGAGF